MAGAAGLLPTAAASRASMLPGPARSDRFITSTVPETMTSTMAARARRRRGDTAQLCSATIAETTATRWTIFIGVPSRARVQGRLKAAPPFITKLTWLIARMSATGSPATATMSASFPASSVPRRSCHPITVAP